MAAAAAAVCPNCSRTAGAKHFGSSGEKAQNQSYDPNIRPALIGSHAEAKATFEALVPLTDVVKLSHEDAPPPDR